MPHRDWLFRITDILAATSTVETYVKDMSSEDFIADRKTVDEVIRNLIIIFGTRRQLNAAENILSKVQRKPASQ